MRFGGSTFIGMLPTLRRIEEMVEILDEPPPGATANSNFVRGSWGPSNLMLFFR